MRRTTIKPKILYQLAKEYMHTLPRRMYPRGGRPRTYDDALILTIASIQNLNQYSFREALYTSPRCQDSRLLIDRWYRRQNFFVV